MSFYIKRGETVYGPFNATQIKSSVQNGDINFADFISKSKEGPWRPFADSIGKPQFSVESLETVLPERQPLDTVRPPALDSGVPSASLRQSLEIPPGRWVS